MSATPSMIHPPPEPKLDAKREAVEESALPPPAPFGPSTWNSFYYACILATIAVGLGSIVSGGTWTDAVVRMFVTLLGGSMLALAFISFVIIPLHVKRYEHILAARQAAQEAAAAKQNADETEDEEAFTAPSFAQATESGDGPLPDSETNLREERATPNGHESNDQAASLRRMASGGRS